jgi:hypothetical protein
VVVVDFLFDFRTVLTLQNSSKINQKINNYHTIGTVIKSNRTTTNTTLTAQLKNLTEKQQIPDCQNSSKIKLKMWYLLFFC